MTAPSAFIPMSGHVRKKVFSKPRSTSGCLTCKSRRVKCDETRPSCNRCLRFETDCGGYGNERGKISGNVRSNLPRLFPRTSNRSQLLLLQPSRDFSFQSEAHGRYFLFFRDEVVPELTGVFSSSLWIRIILQACHSVPFVCKAVIALAALRMSLYHTCATPNVRSAQHYGFALREYDKAIRNMRETLSSSNGESEIRKALIGCLLVFCFESFQGNRDLAISHAKSGYQLLEDWLSRKSPSFSRTEILSSPEPTAIEDDLLDAFYRLDLQIMTIDASRSAELHSKAKKDGANVVAHMPAFFSDLHEAHWYWVLIMRRVHHFIHSALAEARGPYSQDKFKDKRGGPLVNMDTLIHSYLPPEHLAIFQREHSIYAVELMRWQMAFEPFLSSPDVCRNPGADLLQIHCLSTQASLDMLAAKKYDFSRYPESEKFREIVNVARSIVACTSSKEAAKLQSFSIDIGIIPSLLVVIYYCQDDTLREEARGVLYSSERREGVWGTMELARKNL